jgi:cation transport ATPase
MKCEFLLMFVLLFGYSGLVAASEQLTVADLETEINSLKAQVKRLVYAQQSTDNEITELKDVISNNGLALILFAFFCAWWAKTTGRSALLWFFLGILFHIFTAIALLVKTEPSA